MVREPWKSFWRISAIYLVSHEIVAWSSCCVMVNPKGNIK